MASCTEEVSDAEVTRQLSQFRSRKIAAFTPVSSIMADPLEKVEWNEPMAHMHHTHLFVVSERLFVDPIRLYLWEC